MGDGRSFLDGIFDESHNALEVMVVDDAIAEETPFGHGPRRHTFRKARSLRR